MIEIVPATPDDETTLRNLAQLYLYDLTRYMTDWHTNYAGRYGEDDLDGVFSRRGRQPFLLKVDGNLAGFAIIDNKVHSHLNNEDDMNIIVEFFVMAAFQRRGIGHQVAFEMFERFPGKWEVSQLVRNVGAQEFWRKVIHSYTNGKYREEQLADGRVIVQYFDNSDRLTK